MFRGLGSSFSWCGAGGLKLDRAAAGADKSRRVAQFLPPREIDFAPFTFDAQRPPLSGLHPIAIQTSAGLQRWRRGIPPRTDRHPGPRCGERACHHSVERVPGRARR